VGCILAVRSIQPAAISTQPFNIRFGPLRHLWDPEEPEGFGNAKIAMIAKIAIT
jgi:hypothetical protein